MKPPRRILFLAEGQLGDTLVITPALKAAKESLNPSFISILLLYRRKYTEKSSFEDAIIRKSTFKGTAEVFLNNPYIDEVLELDRGALRSLKGFSRLKAELRNIKVLRKHKFDTVICTFPQDRFVLYSFFSGADVRVGQKEQKFSYLLTDKPDVNQNDHGVLNYFCNLIKPVGINCSSYQTIFNIPNDRLNESSEFIKKNNLADSKLIIGIHPGTSQNDRKWLPKSFAEVINFLKQSAGADIILFYSQYDTDFIDEIKKNIKADIIEAMTKSLDELAALMLKCKLCITHSSGPRHLAAAVGVPTLGIFDKCDGVRWGIYDKNRHPVIKTNVACSVCPADRCLGIIPNGEKYSSVCMRDVKEQDVINKLKEMLAL